jgi:hypothetical protein
MAIFHGFGSSKLRSFFAGTRKEGVAMSYEKLTSMCFFLFTISGQPLRKTTWND